MGATGVSDARISTGFRSHWKTKRLIRLAGFEGALCLVSLWAWTAEHRPNGSLAGMDAMAIEDAASWTGETGGLVDALVACGFLDGDTDNYMLHDWEVHNPWACGYVDRSINATRAALKKSHMSDADIDKALKRKYKSAYEPQATRKPTASGQQALRLPGVNGTPAPSPSPLPLPSLTPPTPPDGGQDTVSAFDRFWALYPRKVAKEAARKAWDKLKPENGTVQKILDAVKLQARSQQWQRDGGQFIPHAATWLNQKRWNDEGIKAEAVKGDLDGEWMKFRAAIRDQAVPATNIKLVVTIRKLGGLDRLGQMRSQDIDQLRARFDEIYTQFQGPQPPQQGPPTDQQAAPES